MAHREVVGVEDTLLQVYNKAVELYNKYHRNSEQWIPCYWFRSTQGSKPAQSVSKQMKTCINCYCRHDRDNCKLVSFQSAEALQKPLIKVHFGLSNDSWIEDHSQNFRILHCEDILKYILFLLTYIPFQTHLDFEQVYFAHFQHR